ncbi:hypothetical protein [Priestia megaterium]|uniref:hypothetical protein n=1 Tax=Priestia megaterium TaxID=1404 RepID=UPI002D7F8C15|nr:hypothetical protein [Priestia megaterium]MEB4860614.1 hypothetical protein [Priestia megaterium]
MSVFKNVYFHKLDVYKRVFQKDKTQADKMVKIHQNHSTINDLFEDIIGNKLTNKCISIDNGDSKSTLEILDHDKEYIYAKIGKFKSYLTVQLRNTETLEPAEIQKAINQELEVYTYLLIDRSNYVISFLKEASAPPIQELGFLINNIYSEDKSLFGEISSVTIEDAIPLLKKKNQIGTIKYRMSIPKEEKLSYDVLGLTEKEFEYLSNQKSIEVEVKLVAERNKSAFDSESKIENFIKGIMQKTNKITVKAKNEGEYMQSYNIVDSLLTKKIKFDFDASESDIQVEILRQLKIVYNTNKKEITELIQKE